MWTIIWNNTYKSPAANSRLASCGVMCLNSRAVPLFGFSGRLTVKCSEIPHERQAANRYASCYGGIVNSKMREAILWDVSK